MKYQVEKPQYSVSFDLIKRSPFERENRRSVKRCREQLAFTMAMYSLLPLRFLWKHFVLDRYEVEMSVLCGGIDG